MQREVLTIRKNIPRNSARNSLKMSRLRPSFSFIFLLYSFSIFPCGFLLDVLLVTQQTANSSDGVSVKHWRCRLSPPTRCARTAQADSDVKLSQSVSLGDHKRSTSTSTGVFFQLLSLNFQISLEVVKTKNEMLPVHNTKSTSAHFLTQLSQCDITCLPPERLLNCNGLVLQHKICWGYLLCKSPRRPKSVDPAGVSHTRMWIVKQI